MRSVTLDDLRDVVFGVNENPSIWVKDLFEEDVRVCFSPRDFFVDDDGDIVLVVDCRRVLGLEE